MEKRCGGIAERLLQRFGSAAGTHESAGKVLGRNRVLLGSETGKMRSPVKIDEALYIETHYDAETLMRILTTRILDMVGYDYSKIRIAVKAE